MPPTTTLLAFCAAALILLVVPGPSVMYIVTRSAAEGRAAGIASVLGRGLRRPAGSLTRRLP